MPYHRVFAGGIEINQDIAQEDQVVWLNNFGRLLQIMAAIGHQAADFITYLELLVIRRIGEIPAQTLRSQFLQSIGAIGSAPGLGQHLGIDVSGIDGDAVTAAAQCCMQSDGQRIGLFTA